MVWRREIHLVGLHPEQLEYLPVTQAVLLGVLYEVRGVPVEEVTEGFPCVVVLPLPLPFLPFDSALLDLVLQTAVLIKPGESYVFLHFRAF